MFMNKKWIVLLFVIAITGCRGGGDFRDIALVKQAKRELRRIRNAIEEYKLDHNCYPGEGADLKIALAPYLCNFIYSEGKDIPSYTSAVLATRNNLDELTNSLSGCARIREAAIESVYARIQESTKIYEQLLAGEPVKPTPLGPDISMLQKLISNLKAAGLKKAVIDSLLKIGTQVTSTIDKLVPGVMGEEIQHLKNIKSTFEWYNSELSGKKQDKTVEHFSPEGELATLQELRSDTAAFLEVKTLLSSYRRLESLGNYYDFLSTLIRDIERSQKILKMFEDKLSEAARASKVVQAQAVLHRMADALRDYRRKAGEFPTADADIESILHPYFVETTMSGEQIDRWQSSLGWLTGVPEYKTHDNVTEFTLTSQASNEARTPISIKLVVQNQWDDIVSVFSTIPAYTTPDSLTTYFIKSRAKDTGGTLVTDRPPVIKKGV